MKTTTHFKIDLLSFIVVKAFGTIILLMSFTYYTITHSACTAFDSDLARCETLVDQITHCTDSTHSSDDDHSSTTFHSCGCANIFIPAFGQTSLMSFQKTIYDFPYVNLLSSEFTQRIERPPIV